MGSLPAMLVTPALNAKLIVGTRGRLWLSVADIDDCALQGCGAAVWLSQDGGRQWTNDTPSSTVQCSDSSPASILSDDPAGEVWDTFNAAACTGPASVLNLASGSLQTKWHPVVSWSQFSAMAMSWPSSLVGYAASSTSLLRTDDGGTHWSQVLPSAAPTLTVDSLSAQVAFGAGEAAFGGAVSETSDGGHTWKVQGRVPGTVSGLDFINRQRGYAATTDASTETWRLYATKNGGASWAQVGPVEYTVATPGPAGYTVGQVFGPWINRDGDGVLVGALYATAAQAAVATPSAYVWHTDDGGAQWTKGAPLDAGAPLDTVLAASFLPSNLDQGIVSFVEGPKVVALESTSDGGLQWQWLPTGLQLESLAWADPDDLLGWTPSGGPVATSVDLWASFDGGRHWVPCTTPPEAAGDEVFAIASVSASNNREAWFLDAADGALWRTDDLGRSWRAAGVSDIS
ncbi:MAG: hypothetical protein WBA31_01375 [Candidatus Dormiibacterota bacterium]